MKINLTKQTDRQADMQSSLNLYRVDI